MSYIANLDIALIQEGSLCGSTGARLLSISRLVNQACVCTIIPFITAVLWGHAKVKQAIDYQRKSSFQER
ncbi:hypothetical protein IPC1290_28970 [Pseudomonas aeruginosa]|nr:hypothetical protein IPC1290_28970 [Pseudomonas aeruginosa]